MFHVKHLLARRKYSWSLTSGGFRLGAIARKNGAIARKSVTRLRLRGAEEQWIQAGKGAVDAALVKVAVLASKSGHRAEVG